MIVQIWPPGELVKVFKSMGSCARLGLKVRHILAVSLTTGCSVALARSATIELVMSDTLYPTHSLATILIYQPFLARFIFNAAASL